MSTGYYDTSYPPELWGGGAEPPVPGEWPDIVLSPTTISRAGGITTVTVTSTTLVAGCTVWVGTPLLPQTVTFVSATQLTFTVDPTAFAVGNQQTRVVKPDSSGSTIKNLTFTDAAGTATAATAPETAPAAPVEPQDSPEAPGGTETAQEPPEAPVGHSAVRDPSEAPKAS